jgi:hypothetical protein
MIRSEGEFKASMAMRTAATEIEKAPSAVHLRYLQTLRKISGNNCETIVLPIPLDLLRMVLPTYVQKQLKYLNP